MAITLRQQSTGATSAGTTALTTTFPGISVTGNGLFVLVASTSRDATSVTDDKSGGSNTYAKIQTANFFTSPFVSIWVCNNPSPCTNITANFGSSTACYVVAAEVNGTTSPDVGTNHNANSTNATTGAITTTGADRIVFAALHDAAITAVPTGFTPLFNSADGFVSFVYNVYTSVQTGLNPQWTNATGGYAACILAYSSTITTTPYLPVGPRGLLVPADQAQALADRQRTGWTLPGSTANTSNWQQRPAMVVVPELPREGPPDRRLMPAVLLPTTSTPYLRRRDRNEPPPPPPIQPPEPRPRAFLFKGFPNLPPSPAQRAKELDFVERVPQHAATDMRRMARASDKLSVRVNSLIRKGQLVRDGNEEWSVRSGAFTAVRDPLYFDDEKAGFSPGNLWLNSTTRKVWVCVDNTPGAADWIGPLG